MVCVLCVNCTRPPGLSWSDQGSIVHSLKKITVEADFQILVSIYNPNVLDAKIESGTAVLYHKHTEVPYRALAGSWLGT